MRDDPLGPDGPQQAAAGTYTVSAPRNPKIDPAKQSSSRSAVGGIPAEAARIPAGGSRLGGIPARGAMGAEAAGIPAGGSRLGGIPAGGAMDSETAGIPEGGSGLGVIPAGGPIGAGAAGMPAGGTVIPAGDAALTNTAGIPGGVEEIPEGGRVPRSFYRRVGGSSLGGSTFWGLVQLLYIGLVTRYIYILFTYMCVCI